MQTTKLGDRVRLQYGLVPKQADAQHKPVVPKTCEFTVGGHEVVRGLSLGVVGMAQGERRKLTLQPNEAYGKVRSKFIRQIPRERFAQNIALQVGKRLTAITASSGRRRRVRVLKITRDFVLVDGNHPLAGKVIELEICLVSIDSSAAANRRKPQFNMDGES
jgi:FKBP-type peptidyl-prolyl cis-trans isomerase 2